MNTDIALIESDSVVISMMRANSALAGAVTVSQTKKIMDVARAAEIYAKRQHLSDEAIGQATSVKVEAMRKLGEILQATPKNTGVRGKAGPGRGKPGTKVEPGFNDAPTLDELGLTKKESAVAQKLASLPEKAFEQVRDGSLTITKAIAAVDASKPPAPTIKPDVMRLFDPDSGLSALVLAQRANMAIGQIAKLDPNRFKAIGSIQKTLDLQLTFLGDEIRVPVVPPEDTYTPLDAAQDQIQELQVMLAVANLGTIAEEDKAQAADLIAALRAEIKALHAMNKALTISRDGFQNQVAEMQRQINRQRREIDRATGRKSA
jgi:hypothetical protein